MPIGKAGIDDLGDTRRISRIRNIEQNSVARTGTRSEPHFGIGCDVMALIRYPSGLRARAVVTALPKTCDNAGIGIREYRRPVNDTRRRGVIEGNLNHIDAKQRRLRILERRFIVAALELFARSHRARTRSVNVNITVVVGVSYDSVGMGAATGLYSTDLNWHSEITDVEKSNAAKALGTFGLGYSLQTTVQATASLFHRHNEQITDDRNIALPARANYRAEQLRRAGFRDVVGVKSVIVARHNHVAGEKQIGIREVHQARARLGSLVLDIRRDYAFVGGVS